MTCLHCGGVVRSGEVDGRRTTVCLTCAREHVPAAPVSLARRMTVLDRLNAQAEADVVKAIVAAIRASGGCVLEVGQRKAKGSGSTPGTPDLFAWIPPMADGTWVGLEVKRPGGRIRPEQLALAQRGRIRIVDSVEAAMAALDDVVRASA